MTHRESLAVMLAAASGRDDAARPLAEAHVARCAACWELLQTMRALTVDAAPAANDGRAVYGCNAVEDQLFALVGADAVTIRARQPDVARHLGWCLGCRTVLAQLTLAERDAAAGAYGPPIAGPMQPAWRDTGERAGRRTRALIETIMITVRHGLVAAAGVPGGITAEALVPVDAFRSAGESRTGLRLNVPLPDTGDGAVVLVSPGSEGRVELAARGAFDRATLRVVRGAQDELIGVVPARDDRGIVFRDLPPGAYVLGLVAEPSGELRIPITVAAVD